MNIEQGINNALELIETNFDNSSNPLNVLPYHCRRHTEEVMRRTTILLRAINPDIKNRDTEIGSLAAAYHDLVQTWQPSVSQVGDAFIIKRKRPSPEIEQESADQAVKFMDDSDRVGEGIAFSNSEKDFARESILVTIPRYDPDIKTVIQPNLSRTSSIFAQAVALADLAVCGMEGPQKFLRDTDDLFLEDNLDFFLSLQIPPSELSTRYQALIRDRFFEWIEKQILFGLGRKTYFEEELSFLPQSAQSRVGALFPHFDTSINHLKSTFNNRRRLSYEMLLRDANYLSGS